MDFQKDFDELFNTILTDYKNQFPEADTSQGSLISIKSACLASALWGLYKYQDYIAKQIFPDTADTENLDHHAWLRGLTRKTDETDSEYLARLLDHIRRPPAGGNKYDYVKWAMEIANVESAYCYPVARGLGTVDVVILADAATGSELPSSYALRSATNTSISAGKLIDSSANFTDSANPVRIGDAVENITFGTKANVTAVDGATQLSLSADIFTAAPQDYELKSLTVQVKEYIDDVRPVAASLVSVLAPAVLTQDITMTVSPADVDKTQVRADIEAYLNSFEPGQVLYRSQLAAIAIARGAENATVGTPSSDVTPVTSPETSTYQMIRPGAVNFA